MHRLARTAVLVILSISTGVLEAQQPTRAFELISIRKNLEDGPTISGTRGDTYRATSTSVLRLISYAYHDEIRDDQLVGGPGWLQTDRFDISAKPSGMTINDTRLMVRSLLAERFGLVMAKQQRPGDIYLLKVARADRRPGPDLRRVNDECVNNKSKDPMAALKMQPRPSSGARPSASMLCGTLDDVAAYLAREVKTSVINATGMTGRWDYVLAHSGMQPRLGPDGLALDDRPMLLSAVQDQLGLKLERTRGLVDVWVITAVHPPTEN